LEEGLFIVPDISQQARFDQRKLDFFNPPSPELRTPFYAALFFTELLQLGCTQEEHEEYLGTLMRELTRQKDLINQLLLAGRLESGRMKLESVPMDLLPVLKESAQAIKAMANIRNISIKLETDLTSLNVLGDAGGLSQVFINLINNAVKFSPEGKTVEVVAAKGDNNEACISVIDHGLGIPPDARPHLFERFFRARNVTVAEIPGSGVGLYIVKSIVSELGGRIEVKSELNQGTTFTVYLKLSN
jgi:signal transduction histidine kinase